MTCKCKYFTSFNEMKQLNLKFRYLNYFVSKCWFLRTEYIKTESQTGNVEVTLPTNVMMQSISWLCLHYLNLITEDLNPLNRHHYIVKQTSEIEIWQAQYCQAPTSTSQLVNPLAQSAERWFLNCRVLGSNLGVVIPPLRLHYFRILRIQY